MIVLKIKNKKDAEYIIEKYLNFGFNIEFEPDANRSSSDESIIVVSNNDSFDDFDFAKTSIELLKNEKCIENVEFVPSALPAGEIVKTPKYRQRQFYLDKAPVGIGVDSVKNLPGGKGNGIKIGDIEYACNLEHEDLILNVGGLIGQKRNIYEDHGTAVAGIMCADENEYGVIGICPESQFFLCSNSYMAAVKVLADRFKAGDIIVVEVHVPGPRYNFKTVNNSVDGYIPAEYYDTVFEHIKYATEKGITVVAAGGNGKENLDDEMYERKFDRTYRDSGSIIVGGCTNELYRWSGSNYGSRIDNFGYAMSVATTGFGDLFGVPQWLDKNRWYTHLFGGTSAATPQVAGVCAIIQGMRKAANKDPYEPKYIRDHILKIGATNSRNYFDKIGVMPNLSEIGKFITKFPDYDGDDIVGFGDLLKFIKHFGSSDSLYDFDEDGSVGFSDFLIFQGVYGKRWPIV